MQLSAFTKVPRSVQTRSWTTWRKNLPKWRITTFYSNRFAFLIVFIHLFLIAFKSDGHRVASPSARETSPVSRRAVWSRIWDWTLLEVNGCGSKIRIHSQLTRQDWACVDPYTEGRIVVCCSFAFIVAFLEVPKLLCQCVGSVDRWRRRGCASFIGSSQKYRRQRSQRTRTSNFTCRLVFSGTTFHSCLPTFIMCFTTSFYFQGNPWFDGVQLLSLNPNLHHEGEVKERQRPITTPNGTEIIYEPDYHRSFAKVW